MRHVSRTHRVALDWLFDRINLDPKIQIRYIDTKHQLADILTAGNFTRDEWNNFLHLLNISQFSSTCCTKNFILISSSTMAKRIQDQKEERVVSKSRPAVMNMSSYFVATSSSAASSPIISKSQEMPIASGKPESRMSVEPSSVDAASTSQVRLVDAYLGGLMEEQRRDPSHQAEENSEGSGNPAAGTWYYLHISPDTSHYMEAVFSMVRKIYGKQPGDPMKDLDVNLAIWRMFMNTTLRAAVHLGIDHDTNLRSSRKRLT